MLSALALAQAGLGIDNGLPYVIRHRSAANQPLYGLGDVAQLRRVVDVARDVWGTA